MTSIASPQMTFNFEPSLGQRFATLREYVAFRVQEQRLHAATLASKMDLSPSNLSRKLNQPDGDTQRLNVDDLEAYIKATNDAASVIEYLASKYMDSEPARNARVLAKVEGILPELIAAIAQMKAAS